MVDVMVIGGGASGLLSALLLSKKGKRVLVLEKAQRVGRKLLSTGAGRCNLGNRDLSSTHFYGDTAFLPALLSEERQAQVAQALSDLGLFLRSDEAGRLYPSTFSASSVVDAFRFRLEREGCEIKTGFAVKQLKRKKGLWQAVSSEGESVEAKKVVLSLGGCASPGLGGGDDGYALLRDLGYQVLSPLPALSPLTVEKGAVRGLKGVRLKAALTLYAGKNPLRREEGEVLFTDYGVSGICAMQLCYAMSRQMQKKQACTLYMDLFPECSKEELFTLLQQHNRLFGAQNLFTGLLPRLMGEHVLRRLPEPAPDEFAEKELSFFTSLCKALPFPLVGSQGFAMAQVAAGGLNHTQLDPATLASRKQEDLFVTGELVHIHGDCGGYNLYLCWSEACLVAETILS